MPRARAADRVFNQWSHLRYRLYQRCHVSPLRFRGTSVLRGLRFVCCIGRVGLRLRFPIVASEDCLVVGKRNFPIHVRGSWHLKTVSAYGSHARLVYSLRCTQPGELHVSAPAPASAVTANRPCWTPRQATGGTEVVNTSHKAYSVRIMQAPGYLGIPRRALAVSVSPNESGCDSKQKPARH